MGNGAGVHGGRRSLRRRDGDEAELGLLKAVLWDAARIVAGDSRRPVSVEQLRREREWVYSDSDEWLCSFERICQVLSFQPHAVRQAIETKQLDVLRLALEIDGDEVGR